MSADQNSPKRIRIASVADHINTEANVKSPDNDKSERKRACMSLHKMRKVNKQCQSAADRENFRFRYHHQLKYCEPGGELAVVLNLHCMSNDSIQIVLDRVVGSLRHALRAMGVLEIFPFGSIVSGLSLRDTDIDLFLTQSYPPTGPINYYNTLFKAANLLQCSSQFENIISIPHARVPIIKCKHVETGFHIDINCSSPHSLFNTQFFHDIVHLDERFHELFLFLKIWAKQMNLIWTGAMTSYCFSTLVLFYIQQEHLNTHRPILPSVDYLQSSGVAKLIQGVDYGYNIDLCDINLPSNVTVLQLIKGFYAFYVEFQFNYSIIAPYLGKVINTSDFKSGKFKYSAYELQQQLMFDDPSKPMPRLHVDHCMCVQDVFCLTHNIARSMFPAHVNYFRKCLQFAHKMCSDTTLTEGQLYDALLYTSMDKIEHTDLWNNNFGKVNIENLANALLYSFSPSRNDIRTIMQHNCQSSTTPINWRESWAKLYIEAILEIITTIYLIDLEPAEGGNQNQDINVETEYKRTWILNGDTDTWSSRQHMRDKHIDFMEYHLKQTRYLVNKQSGPVKLDGRIIVQTLENNKRIEVIVTQCNPLNPFQKKDILRKWFAIFKCTLQSCQLKDILAFKHHN